jgi:type IV secretory pathway VirB4 component
MRKNQTATFEQINPFYGIQDNILIGKRGDCSILFGFQPPEINSLGKDGFEVMNNIVSSAIQALPDNYAVQMYDFTYSKISNLNYPITDGPVSIAEQSDRIYFHDRPFIETESYIVITKLNPKYNPITKRVTETSWFNTILKTNGAFENLIPDFENNIKELKTDSNRFADAIANNFGELIKDQEIDKKNIIVCLEEKQIIDLVMNRYLNLSVNKPTTLSVEYQNNKEDFIAGHKKVNIISMNEDGYPGTVFTSIEQSKGRAKLSVSMFNALSFDLSFPHIVVNVFYTKNRKTSIDELESKLNTFGAMLKGRKSSHNDNLFTNIDTFLDEFRKDSSQHLVEHHFSVIVVGENNDLAGHQQNMNKIKNILSQASVQFNESSFTTFAKFIALAPGNVTELPNTERGLVPIEAATCFVNFEQNYYTAKHGLRFVDRKQNRPLFFDFWDNKNLNNRNFAVVGQAGTGKTFTVLSMIDQMLGLDYHVIVVDKVGNYERLAEVHGDNALYTECTERKPLRFNPFLVTKTQKGWIPEPEEVELIVNTIFIALRETEMYNKVIETRATGNLVIAFFNKMNEINPHILNFNTFYEYIEKLDKVEWFNITGNFLNQDEFIIGLRVFYGDGMYGEIFNGESNEALFYSPLVVFDTQKVEDNDTLKVLMSYISGLIIAQKMIKLNRAKPLIVIFDEAWANLEGGAGEYLIKFLYRCCRRYLGSVGVITQSIEDIASSQLKKEITTNCPMLFSFLPSTNEEKKTYSNLFGVSDNQADLLYSLEKNKNSRDVFVKIGGIARVFGVEVCPFKTLLFSSWENHKQAINAKKANIDNIEYAVTSVLENEKV